MHSHRWLLLSALALATGYVWLSGGFVGITGTHAWQAGAAVQARQKPGLAVATFAAGCFWCTEADFDKVPGVVSTTSGYTGGKVADPTYRQVTTGETGHAEAVQVVFDPAVVTYEALLDHFWRYVYPFAAHRQFCDVGNQYRPEIFFHSEAQRVAADASKARIQKVFAGQPVVVA
ncbi:MAG: peptide-methionine (S)-S-oxide reductase MsrA, partial [Acidobacteria bacterium]|nr:peptide-methionine (S)-S-oxide reductase MsrA [Acidobacteriota bacterium]